jgi:hypothetical protein
MAWRRKSKKPTPAKPKALPPQLPDNGPRRTLLADGTVEEWSAATGRSVILPASPARQGLDVRPAAPGWLSAWRRHFGY